MRGFAQLQKVTEHGLQAWAGAACPRAGMGVHRELLKGCLPGGGGRQRNRLVADRGMAQLLTEAWADWQSWWDSTPGAA